MKSSSTSCLFHKLKTRFGVMPIGLKYWLKFIVIFIIAFAVSYSLSYLPHSDLSIFSALLAAGVGIFLAQTKEQYERNQAFAKMQHEHNLANANNHFKLSAESHMAIIAFDKHVAFCEEYVAVFFTCMLDLTRTSNNVIVYVVKLGKIRKKYALWLTKDIENSLDPFEKSLRDLHASNLRVKIAMNNEGDKLVKALEENTEIYHRLLTENLKLGGNEHKETISVETALRQALGSEKLATLRVLILDQAYKRLTTPQKTGD